MIFSGLSHIYITYGWKVMKIILNIYYHSEVMYMKVGKGAKIRNRYNQVPLLTQDTNGKVTNSQ